MTTRDDLALANRLADAAGAAIRPFFRARYDLEIRADKSPVTEADRAAEAAIRAILEKERPHKKRPSSALRARTGIRRNRLFASDVPIPAQTHPEIR